MYSELKLGGLLYPNDFEQATISGMKILKCNHNQIGNQENIIAKLGVKNFFQ